MSRLKHSDYEAYLRYMQMSQATLFAFVEGQQDQAFYGRLCYASCTPARASYQLATAGELPGGAVGKKGLLTFYDFLEARSALCHALHGKTTVAAFFLDKDIDDYCGTCRSSPHAIYTEYYEVENYYFRHGDVILALALAAPLDVQVVRSGLPTPEAWRRTCAEAWRDWVKLCIFARAHALNVPSNYGVRSRINHGADGPVDWNLHATYVQRLQATSGMNNADFHELMDQVSNWVDGLYAKNEYDRVFRGKWYASFLSEITPSVAGSHPYNPNGLEERVLAAAAATLTPAGAWSRYLSRRIATLVRMSTKRGAAYLILVSAVARLAEGLRTGASRFVKFLRRV